MATTVALERLRDTREALLKDITKKQKLLAGLDGLLGLDKEPESPTEAEAEPKAEMSGRDRQRAATKRYWADVRAGRRKRAARQRRSK